MGVRMGWPGSNKLTQLKNARCTLTRTEINPFFRTEWVFYGYILNFCFLVEPLTILTQNNTLSKMVQRDGSRHAFQTLTD